MREKVAHILERLRTEPVVLDDSLPVCPLCGAGALKGSVFAAPHQIEHDCNCSYEQAEAYSRAIQKVWRCWYRPRIYQNSLPPIYREYPLRPWEGVRQVREQVERWMKGGRVLYLYGTPGTGKTHLAVRLGHRFASEGHRTLFFSEGGFYDRARRESLEPEGVRLLEQVDVVVLDDLGKARLTPFAAELLFSLVEAANTGRIRLIITSNYPPTEAAKRLGENAEAMLSRLDVVVERAGKDWRREKVAIG